MKKNKRIRIMHSAGFVALLISLVAGGCNRTYRVTTDSMSNTFNAGQIIKLNKNAPVNRGDIVFFRKVFSPGQAKETRLFRVVAFSGDSVEIKDGNLAVNNKMIELPGTARLLYSISTTIPLDMNGFRKNMVSQLTENKYIAYLTADEYNQTSKLPNVSTIDRIINSPGNYAKGIVRNDIANSWNEDQFGPLYIPAVGEKIKICQANRVLFADILPDLQSDSTVTIKEKLFFLLGDNRSNANDSRFIGLVTESNILGKAGEEP